MALRLLLPLLMLAATLLFAQAQGLGGSGLDCCLQNSLTVVPRNVVISYTVQGPGSGCSLSSVVFTTKGGKKICVSTANSAAKKVMKYVDKVKKRLPQGSVGRPKQRRKQQV